MKETDVSKAWVFRRGVCIGTLERTHKGSAFEYHELFLESLSDQEKQEGGATFHLPYSRKRTETSGVNLHSYFAGLLPEGLRLKSLIQRVKTSEDDLFSLLIASGSDCIGDLLVSQEPKLPNPNPPEVDFGQLQNVDFETIFERVVTSSKHSKQRLASIPGVQDKVSTAMISLPLRGKKSQKDYILKLTPRDKPRILQNEYFFLQMAKDCGLRVNEAKLIKDKNGLEGLVITRFDRERNMTGGIIATHQEDACQFLDRYPADKYRIPVSKIAEALNFCSAPIVETGKLIRLFAFSYLIANGDLHAKNISIYQLPSSLRYELTPAYDLLSTLPYGDQKMALKLDGRDDNLKRSHFLRFGKRFAVKERATQIILDEICDCSSPWISRIEEIGFDSKKTKHLRQTMIKRREDLFEG